MNKNLLLVLVVCISYLSQAQISPTSQWTWASGSGMPNQYGVYGATLHSPQPGNTPGARTGAVTWTDGNGKLWLFGGNGYDDGTNAFPDNLNDLWKYDPVISQWSWENGSTNYSSATPTYGLKGQENAANTPGRRVGALSWTDASGKLWLFGGNGDDGTMPAPNSGKLNDLWKLNPNNGNWTWVSGSQLADQAGEYTTGTIFPGGRSNAATWTDASGNLWLFGGFGIDKNGLPGYLNDTWKYSPLSDTWTWIGGSDTRNQAGTSTYPGGRQDAVYWRDTNGDLWLFGGYGYDNFSLGGLLNDLWKFNTATQTWTFICGSTSINNKGVYGTQGIGSTGNIPGGRSGSVGMIDAANNLWLFGGNGYDANGPGGNLNDLWKYEVSTQKWTWIKGNSTYDGGTFPNYPLTQGSSTTTSDPGGLSSLSAWKTTNNFWLFGGTNPAFDLSNDLWSITLDPIVLPVKLDYFNASSIGSIVQLQWATDLETNADYYVIERSVDGISFNNIGRVAAKGNSSNKTEYSFNDATPAHGNNFYRLKQVDKNGKYEYSLIRKVNLGDAAFFLKVRENPFVTSLHFTVQATQAQKIQVSVKDNAGKEIFRMEKAIIPGDNNFSIESTVPGLSKGIYFLQVSGLGHTEVKKLMKQ